ncbi:MAG: antitoxin family protein [Phycisphaerales bacterium JB039]
MVRKTEAIFTGGVLRPLEPLGLREQERVRITIESAPADATEQEAARQRMIEGFEKMRLRTNGRLPTRDELHERR